MYMAVQKHILQISDHPVSGDATRLHGAGTETTRSTKPTFIVYHTSNAAISAPPIDEGTLPITSTSVIVGGLLLPAPFPAAAATFSAALALAAKVTSFDAYGALLLRVVVVEACVCVCALLSRVPFVRGRLFLRNASELSESSSRTEDARESPSFNSDESETGSSMHVKTALYAPVITNDMVDDCFVDIDGTFAVTSDSTADGSGSVVSRENRNPPEADMSDVATRAAAARAENGGVGEA